MFPPQGADLACRPFPAELGAATHILFFEMLDRKPDPGPRCPSPSFPSPDVAVGGVLSRGQGLILLAPVLAASVSSVCCGSFARPAQVTPFETGIYTHAPCVLVWIASARTSISS